MKIIDNILWIEYCDFLTSGWNENTLKNANFRNGSRWQMIANPEDKRKPLVKYDTLVDAHKEKIKIHFGNPYDYVAKEPIKALVEKDFKAEEFYRQYRYDGDKRLLDEHVYKYTTACSWLNMLQKITNDKQYIKKSLNLTLDSFWLHVCQLIKTDNIDLPTTYQRLNNKVREYMVQGYDCLIDWRFGNKLAAKIGKTDEGFDPALEKKQMAVIRKVASMHNNFDAMQVTTYANVIYSKNGWQVIGVERVKQLLKELKPVTSKGARGTKVYNNQFAMQVKRSRPEYPLYYATMDGWTVELLYQTEDNKYNRLVIVVVLDPMNDYPLGYAIGDRENIELIKQANRNAIIHINELFGKPYRPWQLQSDNYGIKSLTPYYQAFAKLHTPAAVGNAKAKVIEPYFKYLNKTYCQPQFNWSGFNVTAKQSNQPNAEMLNTIRKHLPNKQDVIGQIVLMMEEERKRKAPDYIQQFAAMDETDKVVMAKEDVLMLFGKTTGYTNTITGLGLQPTINGEKLLFDSFEPKFRANQHLKWQVFFDDSDLSQVLAISEDNKHRFVLNQKRSIPMDIKSMTPEDHAFLTQISGFKKERKEEIVQTYLEDEAIVAEIIEDTPLSLNDYTELSLKLMFTDKNGQQKEGIQDAKGLKPTPKKIAKKIVDNSDESEDWQAKRLKWMQDKINQ